jgi:hypothetical protein
MKGLHPVPHANPADHIRSLGASVGDEICAPGLDHTMMICYIGKDYVLFECHDGSPYVCRVGWDITEWKLAPGKPKYDAVFSTTRCIYIRRDGKPIGHFAPEYPGDESEIREIVLGGLDRLNKGDR